MKDNRSALLLYHILPDNDVPCEEEEAKTFKWTDHNIITSITDQTGNDSSCTSTDSTIMNRLTNAQRLEEPNIRNFINRPTETNSLQFSFDGAIVLSSTSLLTLISKVHNLYRSVINTSRPIVKFHVCSISKL